jgi:hypothetical protein
MPARPPTTPPAMAPAWLVDLCVVVLFPDGVDVAVGKDRVAVRAAKVGMRVK